MRETQRAAKILEEGGVIAYPTEAVYGLGCDPFNEPAVMRVLKLKNRMPDKGVILIAHDWKQLQPLVQYLPPDRMQPIFDTWPGPVTWVFPASELVPIWIRGTHLTIAVRVTNHPIASLLCKEFGNPIVSTSANIEGKEPARDEETVKKIFNDKIDLLVSGFVGDAKNPTEIRDALSGKILRRS
jgi:L-threonylcarbamoyladenylate synthase